MIEVDTRIKMQVDLLENALKRLETYNENEIGADKMWIREQKREVAFFILRHLVPKYVTKFELDDGEIVYRNEKETGRLPQAVTRTWNSEQLRLHKENLSFTHNMSL